LGFALVLVVHYRNLPAWIMIIAAACMALRLLLAARGREAPPQGVTLLIAVLCIALLFLKFRTFNGLAAGTALLALTCALKLLETKTQRDVYIITLGVYFFSLAALLQSESFWLLTYLIAVCWFTTLVLLRTATRQPSPAWGRTIRYGGRLFLQALPLAIIFWLLFPRLATPLWSLPGSAGNAATGLSDSMSPGDITQLAQSDEVAFRVHFKGPAPPPRDQYWRGPVLHAFDGRSWRRDSFQPSFAGSPPQGDGALFRYTVTLEPHPHNWIYALDHPASFKLARGSLTTDFTLSQPLPVDSSIDVEITSRAGTPLEAAPDGLARARDLHVDKTRNPRSQQLAQGLRAAHPDPWEWVQAVLQMFAQQDYFYTLTPPPLGRDSVDDFLFNSKRGFCGHYASAFALLARSAGIPARVVTGYQGGTYNRFGDYWIVRQREAHAWDEVWIDGRGWVRVDPTSAIDASRVEQSVNDEVTDDEPLTNHWQRHWRWFSDARLRLDELGELWREQILTFNQDSQERLLKRLHIPEPDAQKLILLLAAMLALVLVWLTWQVRRELDPKSKDPALRGFLRLCNKLAAVGIPRHRHEGALDYALRVSRERPDLKQPVTALCEAYAALRYSAAPEISASAFEAAVRAFKARRVPQGSSG
jgi:transglutaminase-like putative cysteine protease